MKNKKIEMLKAMRTFKPSRIAKLFRQVPDSYDSLEVRLTDIKIKTGAKHKLISFEDINGIEKSKKWFWTRVILNVTSGKLIIGGLWHKEGKKLEALILIIKFESSLIDFHSWLDERNKGNYWVSNYDTESAVNTIKYFDEVLDLSIEYFENTSIDQQVLQEINKFKDNPNKFRGLANKTFVPLELERFKEYFDSVEKYPLTDSQRQAIITNEDNTRVIAGAGSGKTSVIVSKAGYLLKKGLFTESEILLVAFNHSAAKEMKSRIKNFLNANIQATTFHALGHNIIATAENRKPSLAKIAESKSELEVNIHEILIELVKDPKTTKIISTYFQSFFAPYKPKFDFVNRGDYYKYIKDNNIISLNGENLKSYEEVEIANFLCLNGIDYSYEKQYSFDTATVEYRQYEPDFYLPDYDIYIEHFGIRQDGSTAPFINSREYWDGIKWKRRVHKFHKTTLIETYSFEKKDGNLTENLKHKLLNLGVILQPIDPNLILEKLNSTKSLDPVTNLVATFLNHFKGGKYSIEEVREQARTRKLLDRRLKAFLSIFERIIEYYEDFLNENRVIDFNDMINRAVDYVENKKYISPYRYILVDEFQDISKNRSDLIHSLCNQDPSHRLFCVGDDWQAIYRFAGSDISIMREFSQVFGFTETVALDETFRFNNSIENVASRFILENPSQIRKAIEAQNIVLEPRVFLHRPEIKADDLFLEVLGEISRRNDSENISILCLGRYNFLQDGLSWSIAHSKYPKWAIDFKTVHSAKGLEADYVIVFGMRSGKFGFPSEISDDPIVNAVLSEPESFTHAEERRLFYVALTRARHAVHLIIDYNSPSSFVTEIREYEGLVVSLGAAGANPVYCPSCESGQLIQRTGQYGIFYSCQYFPLCDYNVKPCSRCGIGLMVPEKTRNRYICNHSTCNHIERICPRCKTGRLVERNGTYGPFFGCTNYPSEECEYTENIN
jgi:DNA helicase IV